ncbi:phosphorylase family protein [Planctomicrobium sp. SH664]|uniref:phosphorylase family protein n=1 Tax=Planctomicrobium sp. SH664 TaxID=3448125 RepID=UPI003F5AFE41
MTEPSFSVSIGIVCALNLEIAPFLQHCEQLRTQSGNGFKFRGCRLDDIRICVVEGGAGLSRARRATNALIDAFHPEWIFSVGFSGALTEDLRRGDLVVGTSLTDASQSTQLDIDVKLQPNPRQGLHVGRLCSVDHIVREVDEKKGLAQQSGAIAVDMESLAVAQVCRERPTRFMAIRGISDDLSEDLPREVLAILGPKGSIRAGALVASLLKRPSCVKDLWKLREQSTAVAARLARLLVTVVKTAAETPTSRPQPGL